MEKDKSRKSGNGTGKKKWKYFNKIDGYANYANQMTCDVFLWSQSGIKSQKNEYLSQLFLYKAETQYSCCTHHKVP